MTEAISPGQAKEYKLAETSAISYDRAYENGTYRGAYKLAAE